MPSKLIAFLGLIFILLVAMGIYYWFSSGGYQSTVESVIRPTAPAEQKESAEQNISKVIEPTPKEQQIPIIPITGEATKVIEQTPKTEAIPKTSSENESTELITNTTLEQPSIPPQETKVESTNAIKIATWNIENFGKTKASDSSRMQTIANVIKNYDLIAVQEISNVKETSDVGCPRNEGLCPDDSSCSVIRNALQKYLNENLGLGYKFVFSPHIKDERYLYIYNPEKITLVEFSLVNDPEDSLPICDSSPTSTGKMVRQPFKAKFKSGNFDFVLLTVHTSPSINIQELEGLAYFYNEVEKEGESDVIILGDLNADCSYLKTSDNIALRNPEYIWVVDDFSDTTVAQTNCAYDRLIFKNPTKEDFAGSWGIVDTIPDNVSDHYLVWAEFSTSLDSN